ncbi:MAG: FAD-dependent oxidoreductase [Candidatus Lokiarchaeota archaeon]|nr:FAD-dependent oxidoreductase [Candidatus Lokiarchaeota archaeon]MBD3198400.1 FAD-dependent oxidoreductase [Candidatus Lokiarchaeota archaeon]
MSQILKNQEIQDTYDVIIIGAGNGGLIAGATLAKEGLKTIIIERHNLPGGFATSFVRGRFEFEASLHELADYGPPENKGGIRRLFEDKLDLEAEFARVPEAYRLVLTHPDKELDVSMPFGVEKYLDKMEDLVPGSRESVEKFFNVAKEIRSAFRYIASTHGNPDQGTLMKEYTNFLKTAAYSAEEVEIALGIPEKARKILNAYWAYLGLPTERINFTIFASMILVYIEKGAYIPKNRSHGYTTALDKKIKEMGGKILYNTTVNKILVEDGQVIGVETLNGDKIMSKHIISNASPTLAYNKLIYPQSEVPDIAYKEVNARIHGMSAFCVFLGLDASVEELGLDEYSYFIMEDMDTSAVYDSWLELQVPKGQATVVINNAVPDCSPPGTSLMYITTLFDPKAWENVKPEEYFKIKSKIANGLIKQFEEATGAPISDHIEEIEIASPETYARYTGTYNGIIYGYEPESWDSLVPRLMSMNDDIHIKGLRFAGGFGARCHGYSSSMSDGHTVALLTLQDIKKGGDSHE